jgi:hypothetical protein
MVHVVDKALDVGLSHRAIPPVWPVTGQVSDRLPRPTCRPVPLTTSQNLLRIDRLQDSGTGGLEACILDHRDAMRKLPLSSRNLWDASPSVTRFIRYTVIP